jgi:predicted methyltransferase
MIERVTRLCVLFGWSLLSAALVPTYAAAPATAPTSAPSTGPGLAPAAPLDAAFASPDRPQADREQDERRQSRAVLEFLGVKPGMRVIDVFSAGGYNTELLARTVGVKGQVIAYNNPAYAAFAAKGIDARYANERLGNVRQVTAEPGALELAPSSLDAALIVMSYHDAYWRPKDGSFDKTDPAELLARLFSALKPGGVVVVQDHVANPGAEPRVSAELHRIDPARVRSDFEHAGFVFDGSLNVLAHPADDHTRIVFDPSVQGRTDQFVYRFRKPAA